MPEVGIEGVEVELGRDETIMLFTDGVTKARDAQGKELGEAALRDALAAHTDRADDRMASDVVTTLLAETRAHLRDDLAMLTLTLEG